MRDPDRKDKDGKPRSLGWAFVEFEKHEYALAVCCLLVFVMTVIVEYVTWTQVLWGSLYILLYQLLLQALRKLNNNPEYYSQQKRLIVEFAVEDGKKVKIQKDRHQHQPQSKVC